MTTLTTPAGPSSLRRVGALAAAETLLLARNRTAVVNSVITPLLLVAAVPVLGFGAGEGGHGVLTTAVGVTLVFLTYYNLVTTYVARREDLVLQRLRTGELGDGQVLLATAVPTLLVTVGQLVLVTVGVALLGRWQAPADPVLPVLAVLLGAALMVALATASTTFTRSPESAQITTLPVVLVATALSGLFFPLSLLPDALATAARLLPVTPVVELVQLGLSGRTWEGGVVAGAELWWAALGPLGTLLAWTTIAGFATARWFRWAPRR